MARALMWVFLGLLLSMTVVPREALEVVWPLFAIIIVGMVVTLVAGLRGRRLDRAEQDEAEGKDT